MTDIQLYVYLIGFVFFFIGVYFHIQKSIKIIDRTTIILTILVTINYVNSLSLKAILKCK